MKKLYIHIGLPKTATSSIQNFLFKQNDTFLNKHGYHYMNTGVGIGLKCHHYLIWALGLHQGPAFVPKDIQKNKDAILQELAAENTQHSDKHLIISSELLTFLDDFKKLAPILEIFKNRDIKFIVNLRRQDTFLESLYQQIVKDGLDETFKTWFSKTRNAADYNQLIRNILQITEKENIAIGTFNNSHKREFNPIKAFLPLIDIYDETITIENIYTNKRLPTTCIKIIQLSNSLNLKINHRLVNFFLKHKNIMRLLDNNGKYLDNEQRAAIREEYKASNKALTEQIEMPLDVKNEILSW